MAAVDVQARPDGRRASPARHGPGERAGIPVEVLAERVVPKTIPLAAADLEAWLLAGGLARDVGDGRLAPTARAVEIIAALDD